eukprot:g1565.t1
MYSTKRYCDKQYLFTTLGNTNIGDPYRNSKEKLDSRFKGKQFLTQPGKKGRLPPTYKLKSDPFDDTRSKGKHGNNVALAFGSKDIAARGEFSDTLNVRRNREKMHFENKIMYKQAAKEDETSVASKKPNETLFDSVFSESYIGRFDREPLPSMKPKVNTRKINNGKWKTSAREIGRLSDHRIPQSVADHGIKGVVKDFYDTVGTGM